MPILEDINPKIQRINVSDGKTLRMRFFLFKTQEIRKEYLRLHVRNISKIASENDENFIDR